MAAYWRARLAAGVAMVMLLGSAFAPGPAVAAPPARGAAAPSVVTFTVNTTNDAVADFTGDASYTICKTGPANGFCSLRAAVMNANRHAGGATIILPAGTYGLTTPPVTPDDDASGDLNITSTVTIVGAGALSTIVDGGGTDRVFDVIADAALTLTGVTIRHGHAVAGGGVVSGGQLSLTDSVITGNSAEEGGGLYEDGPTIVLTNVTITGNTAVGYGGGLVTNGWSTLTHVIIAGNTAGDRGGGLFVGSPVASLAGVTVEGNTAGDDGGGIWSNDPLTLTDSTVDHNQSASRGGGVYSGDSLTVFNSTISNNLASNRGGGIFSDGGARFFQATITGNLVDAAAFGGGGANNGGGIYNNNLSAPVQLWNTLLADNYISITLNDCDGNPLTSEDYNYFEVGGCTINRAAGITHDVIGGDPLLASLADNGGATQTRALLVGSPALDQISATAGGPCRDPQGNAPVPDQRGVARPVGPKCDIGAYEGQLPLTAYLRNLVRNGDAEAAAGTPMGDFVGVPDWGTPAGQLLTVVPYNAPNGFPSVPTDTVPAVHGYNFFAGGVSAVAVVVQNIDVSPLAAGIDGGGVTFDFSADLGGYANQEDNAKVEADFYDQGNHLLTQSFLGPVTMADRGSLTGLLHREDSESVPINTRTVVIYVTLTSISGPNNDGYADNISLVLLPRAALYLPALMR